MSQSLTQGYLYNQWDRRGIPHEKSHWEWNNILQDKITWWGWVTRKEVTNMCLSPLSSTFKHYKLGWMNRIIKRNSKLPTQFYKALRFTNSFTKFSRVSCQILHRNIVIFIPNTSELPQFYPWFCWKMLYSSIFIYFSIKWSKNKLD